MTLSLITDHLLYKGAERLRPHHYAMDTNRPLRISGDVRNTNESKITIRHWIESNY
jgi:hypothetical protein